jgi:hypothetical protein
MITNYNWSTRRDFGVARIETFLDIGGGDRTTTTSSVVAAVPGPARRSTDG